MSVNHWGCSNLWKITYLYKILVAYKKLQHTTIFSTLDTSLFWWRKLDLTLSRRWHCKFDAIELHMVLRKRLWLILIVGGSTIFLRFIRRCIGLNYSYALTHHTFLRAIHTTLNINCMSKVSTLILLYYNNTY